MTEEILRNKMVEAWKGGDKFRKDTLSSLLSTAKKMAIDSKSSVTEEIINQAISKELKTSKEQIESCPKERTELLNEYTNRFNIINEFAPKMMSNEEIIEELNNNFSNEISTKDKRIIMKVVMPYFKGKANGKDVSNIIDNICRG